MNNCAKKLEYRFGLFFIYFYLGCGRIINACEVASVDYINDLRLHTVQSWLANETVLDQI